MPSPNGYFDCGAAAAVDRNWWRATITHDVNSPPWLPGQAGNYEFEINIGTAAVGPFTAAPLTALANECSPQPDNRITVGGTTQTLFGVGGPAALLADTDYWLEIVLRDPDGVEVDRYVCGPVHTEPYPAFICLAPQAAQTTADVHLAAPTGRPNITPPCNQDTVVWEIATALGGPYTAAPAEPVTNFAPAHTFTGLTQGTTYYYRARFTEQAQTAGEYLVTPECSFTTQEAPVTTPPFQPQPCDTGSAGSDAVDVEQMLLCDTLPDGTIAGTAMAVWEYDAAGAPMGAPTFVDPATGTPYVAQGTLMPCPGETGCLEPVAFHRTTTSTSPVDHPGRQYDITLPINPGFAVQSLQVDQVTNAANIVWDVADPDGEQFRQDLTAFIEGRIPAAATVTITNPNAGQVICGTAAPMQIHIECLRLDQSPPDLIELVYNGGQDMVINPAYNETPPLNPPVSQGNYGFHLLGRQDNNVYPGNPPANRANCTNVANRGWETNDVGRTFEIWGQDIVNGSNVTPTPRGTPVQEMTSDGPPPGGRSTIWQTFQAPASANFIIRVVHGARDAGENHRITLDNGDTDDAQNGDLIDDTTTNVGVVTNSAGGPGPWTQFSQTIPLTGGNTYTLALSTNNPVAGARGGLFTDMRAYIDRPDLRATATADDDTCVVTVDETTTACQDELWSPICESGTIQSWQSAETGAILSNSAFWGQAPAPVPGPCPATAASDGGGSVAANLVHTYSVCATVGGVRTNLQRVVITDGSGGVLADSFIGPDGGPVPTPSSYSIGSCTDTAFMNDEVLCDDNGPFLRKYVQAVSDVGQPQVKAHGDFTLAGMVYTPVGTVGTCGGEATLGAICYSDPDLGIARPGFLTRDADGTAHVYNLSGVEVTPFPVIVICAENSYYEEILCDQGAGGHQFIRRYIGSPIAGVSGALGDFELDGSTEYTPVGPVGVCDSGCDPVTSTGLCLADGTPIGVVTRRDCDTGTVTQDGWINLLTGAFTAGPPPAGAMSCSASQSVQVSGTFCDVDGNGDVQGLVLIEYHYAADGTIESVRLVNATTGATYVPVGTVTTCPAGATQPEQDVVILCDVNAGVPTPFVRDYRRDENGAVVGFTNYTLAGAPYAPTGTVGVCQPTNPVDRVDAEAQILCDANGTRFLRTYAYDAAGVVSSFTDRTLAGAAFAPVGAVGTCGTGVDSESFILCDSAATPNRFVRTYTYGATGAVTGFTDTTLAGAAFVPTGAVGVCAQTVQADTDFVEEVLCDQNGTAFIRLFRFNSVTGALVSTTNTTLAGAAFAPVGTVGICSDCCPVPVGEGCTNTGSGRYTAIRAANGTITLIDSVTGTAITAANIVACPSDDTIATLTAQGRLIGDADAPWTPGGDVVGTLTSVTLTVLSGTCTLTDQSGTVLAGLPAGYTASWSVADENTLTGPTSIDAIGGQTAVVWTQR